MPSFAHTETVAASPEHVFAIIDDFTRTPEWLTRCTGIDKLEDGPNHAGLPLKYHYKDGSRTGTMDGEVAAREQDRHLTLHFVDKMTDVTVDFKVAPMGAETSLTHEITIQTKGFGKLFTPMIKRALPRQTLDAMTKLKALAES
ncbi:carbon monoxide dehydrogenase subunit G [Nocardioides ginsengisegetis]|uniref:Carbon monoxide dehydrogenase subunit G n=2 Tax=Nocardioides ginsengisegetis TaxID=661491 RepID=A0A7W3PBI7_9ACTN|nr:SRPBCC family protein [Nocardioides ginsengisegetis]MBA8805616.1 carbon monoxide dehydrogenase subunit G [Nocardioides ginsengisegetis]